MERHQRSASDGSSAPSSEYHSTMHASSPTIERARPPGAAGRPPIARAPLRPAGVPSSSSGAPHHGSAETQPGRPPAEKEASAMLRPPRQLLSASGTRGNAMVSRNGRKRLGPGVEVPPRPSPRRQPTPAVNGGLNRGVGRPPGCVGKQIIITTTATHYSGMLSPSPFVVALLSRSMFEFRAMLRVHGSHQMRPQRSASAPRLTKII